MFLKHLPEISLQDIRYYLRYDAQISRKNIQSRYPKYISLQAILLTTVHDMWALLQVQIAKLV